MFRTINQRQFQCHLKYKSGVNSTKAEYVHHNSEDHDAKYAVFFILCPIIDKKELPISVGITDKEYEGDINEIVNFVQISYPNIDDDDGNNIALCPGPVFSDYNNALRIAEYVEIYKLMGASKFYIYNVSMSQDVAKLFEFYESIGTVEILPWNIADVVQINQSVIHHYGIIACLNDCFYRATNVDKFKYFIHADFDEIIYSYKTDTLTEFLEINDKADFHSFGFLNYFFLLEYGQDFSNIPSDATNKFLFTQAQTTRTNKPMNRHQRSKYIAKRDSAVSMGNHFVWNGIPGTGENYVNVSLGALHHYRENCKIFDLCKAKTEHNDYARKFGDKLYVNVDKVCKEIYSDGKCPLGKNFTINIDSI